MLWITVLLHNHLFLSFSSQTWLNILLQDSLLESRIHVSSVMAKHPSLKYSTSIDCRYGVFVWFCNLARLPNSSTFGSSVIRKFSQKVWQSSRCVVAQFKQASMFFRVSSGFHLVTHPWMLFRIVYRIVESWTLNFFEVRETCSSTNVFHRSIVTSWISRCLAHSWTHFGRSATSGKVHYSSKVKYFFYITA